MNVAHTNNESSLNNSTPSALDYALGYIALGWCPVPIPRGQKGPKLQDWQHLRLTPDIAPQFFGGGASNVGVILGSASGELADVDLDCPEALALAPYLLPATATFGRTSKPASHWIYRCSSVAPHTDQHKLAGDTLVELRANGGHQTVFPGSVHPSGEVIVWHSDPRVTLATVDGADLERRVKLLAISALLLRRWTSGRGGRHTLALSAAGGLLQAGLEPDEVRLVMAAVLECAGADADGSSGPRGDSLHAVETTIEAAERGETKLRGFASTVADGILDEPEHKALGKMTEGFAGRTLSPAAAMMQGVLGAANGNAPAQGPAVAEALDLPKLTSLAHGLMRRKDPAEQRVGRALRDALGGTPFGVDAPILIAVAHAIARKFPAGDADHASHWLQHALRGTLGGEGTAAFAAEVRAEQARGRKDAQSAAAKDGDSEFDGSVAAIVDTLTSHPAWCGVLAYNEFAARVDVLQTPPMRDADRPTSSVLGEWTDTHTNRARTWIGDTLGAEPTKNDMDDAVEIAARKHAYHPVRRYLSGLQWDYVFRLHSLLPAYFGAEETEYVRQVGAKTLISAVARAMAPGCKVDTMLILEGEQGTKKSSALRALASPEWFADTPLDLESKDAAQNLSNVWIYEIGELHALKRAEVTRIKAFLSAQADKYRPSYGRRSQAFARQGIFIGTTNGETYLTDTTGNRRYWPVKCGQIDLEAIKRDRDHLWAEAVWLYSVGTPWWFVSRADVQLAESEQAKREEEDPWRASLAAWLDRAVPPNNAQRTTCTTDELLTQALGLRPAEQTRANAIRVGAIVRSLGGWQRRQRTGVKGREWFYERWSAPTAPSRLVQLFDDGAAQVASKPLKSPTAPTAPSL